MAPGDRGAERAIGVADRADHAQRTICARSCRQRRRADRPAVRARPSGVRRSTLDEHAGEARRAAVERDRGHDAVRGGAAGRPGRPDRRGASGRARPGSRALRRRSAAGSRPASRRCRRTRARRSSRCVAMPTGQVFGVALPRHHAAERDQRRGAEPVFVGAERRRDRDVAAGLEAAVGLQHHASAQPGAASAPDALRTDRSPTACRRA